MEREPENTVQAGNDHSSVEQDNSGPIRFLALFFMCLLGFGEYYNPSLVLLVCTSLSL